MKINLYVKHDPPNILFSAHPSFEAAILFGVPIKLGCYYCASYNVDVTEPKVSRLTVLTKLFKTIPGFERA